jgi:hypothetical protein
MHEFMIHPKKGGEFGFPFAQYSEALKPSDIPSQPSDEHGTRILVEGAEISFSDEQSGFQVVFESGSITSERAEQIVAAICSNIQTVTGEAAVYIQYT